jgi:hypothetical protein
LLIASLFSRFESSLFVISSFLSRLVSLKSFFERASFLLTNAVVYRESSLSSVNLTSYFEEFDSVSSAVSSTVSFVASSFVLSVTSASVVTKKRTRQNVSNVSNKKEKTVEKACVCIVSKK